MANHVCVAVMAALIVGMAYGESLRVMVNGESHNEQEEYLNMIPDQDLKDYITIMNILAKPRATNKVKGGFTWKNCSKTADLVTLDKLMVAPDKLKIPGTVNVTASATIHAPLDSPIQLSLKVKKKVFAWIDVPCIDGFGSCDYDDICDMIKQISCPTALPDCYCPYPPGLVTLNNVPIDVDVPGIPSFLSEGEYQVEARALHAGQQVFCLQMSFTLA